MIERKSQGIQIFKRFHVWGPFGGGLAPLAPNNIIMGLSRELAPRLAPAKLRPRI